MNHVVTETSPGELGFGCKCGKRFPTRKTAEGHVADQNLIEANEAKAQTAAVELEHQAKEPADPEGTDEAAKADVYASKPEPAASPQTTKSENEPRAGAGGQVAAPSSPEPTADEKPPPPAPVPETPQALSPSNLPLDLENLSLNQINFIGQTMAKSGMFPDVTDGAKALVKILAGKEIGVTPFQAMTNIHIIQGMATMGANLMAAKVKGSGKYDYRVMDLTSETCSILFRQRDSLAEGGWADLGKFTYSLEDAKRAGLVKTGSSWEKYPKNMLFARAISSGVRIYCPDVFNGNLVYVPEELGAQVNEDGEPVGKAA